MIKTFYRVIINKISKATSNISRIKITDNIFFRNFFNRFILVNRIKKRGF